MVLDKISKILNNYKVPLSIIISTIIITSGIYLALTKQYTDARDFCKTTNEPRACLMALYLYKQK
jgi:predicted transporter